MTAARNPAEANRILYIAAIVSSLVMLDSNVVAVALPTIARSIGADFSALQWVITAYVLPFAALLLAAGSWADIYGRKKAIMLGQFIFALASLFCGIATTPLLLNLARAVQGVGASLLLTAALAIINNEFQGKERARAYAFWGSCLGIAITCGPIIGGVISNYWGWNWVFLINVPICAVLMFTTQKIIPESKSPVAKKLDYAGVATFSIGLFLLTWAVIDGNALGWSSTAISLRLAGGIVLLLLFVVVERRQQDPMVDFSLLTTSRFTGSALAMIGYAGGAQVMIFYLPVYLQKAYGYEPAAAGLAMLPFALPMFLIPKVGARLSATIPSKTILGMALAITASANLLMALVSVSDMSYGVFAAVMIWAGVGAGLLNSETAKALQGAIPAERAGMASGVSATVRFTGLLLSVAALGAVLAATTTRLFSDRAASLGLSPDAARELAKHFVAGEAAQAHAGGVDFSRYQDALRHAFDAGFASTSIGAALIAAVCLVLMYLIMPRGNDVPASARNDLNSVVVPGE